MLKATKKWRSRILWLWIGAGGRVKVSTSSAKAPVSEYQGQPSSSSITFPRNKNRANDCLVGTREIETMVMISVRLSRLLHILEMGRSKRSVCWFG